jgi:ribosome maturation protein Sdo1
MPANQTSKCVLKVDSTEFFVMTYPGKVAEWKKDKTIPLVDVVQNFSVFTTSTGSNTGEVIHPPKGILESAFDTSNQDEIVKKILEDGVEKNF